VSQVTRGQLKIEKSFDVSKGLTGHVLQATSDPNQETIAFIDKKAKHLFIGSLIDQKGENLTQEYTDKYITVKKAKRALSDIRTAHFIADGSESAPHKTYVFMDPNCSYCHLLYNEILPFVKKGTLEVRWIPVAIRPQSEGKAARILHADPKNAVALIAKDEANFSMQTEQGSLTPLKKSKDKAVLKAFTDLAANNKLFSANFNGTPVILFKNSKGQPQVIPGFVHGAQLSALIDSMSGTW
jgi:thiol:disulfide interchange protein DsbG